MRPRTQNHGAAFFRPQRTARATRHVAVFQIVENHAAHIARHHGAANHDQGCSFDVLREVQASCNPAMASFRVARKP